MTRFSFLFLILILFSTTVTASDWLLGGYVGTPDYSEIRKYFTDPIFFMKVPVSLPQSFYGPYSGSIYPYHAVQSEFRNRSLAAMQWEPMQKNWTATMSYAQCKSSFRVFEEGTWRNL